MDESEKMLMKNKPVKCGLCGCSIRFGRFCPECARTIMGDIYAIFSEDVGKRPKYKRNLEMAGKMHYLTQRIK